VQPLYHLSSAQSTPSSACTEACSPTRLALELWGREGRHKMQIPVRFKIEKASVGIVTTPMVC